MFTNIKNKIWKKIEKYGLGTEEEYKIVEEKRNEDKNESSSISLQMRNNQEVIQLRAESWPTKMKTALTGTAITLILSKEKKTVRIKTNIKDLKKEIEKKGIRDEANPKMKENLDQLWEVIRRIVKMKELKIIITYKEEISKIKTTETWKTDIM